MTVANHIRKNAKASFSTEENAYILAFEDGKTLSVGQSVRVNSKQFGATEIEVQEITPTTTILTSPSGQKMSVLLAKR
ncbi:MAG: hypothetical protein ACQKBW_05545 [Puniceicoccales bacterium]